MKLRCLGCKHFDPARWSRRQDKRTLNFYCAVACAETGDCPHDDSAPFGRSREERTLVKDDKNLKAREGVTLQVQRAFKSSFPSLSTTPKHEGIHRVELEDTSDCGKGGTTKGRS